MSLLPNINESSGETMYEMMEEFALKYHGSDLCNILGYKLYLCLIYNIQPKVVQRRVYIFDFGPIYEFLSDDWKTKV